MSLLKKLNQIAIPIILVGGLIMRHYSPPVCSTNYSEIQNTSTNKITFNQVVNYLLDLDKSSYQHSSKSGLLLLTK